MQNNIVNVIRLKRIVKRRFEFYKRSKRDGFSPLHVVGKAVRIKKRMYDNQVEQLLMQIEDYSRSMGKISYPKMCGDVPFEDYHILSYNGDQMGKVLEKESRIYRGIYRESVSTFEELWNSGLLQVLGEKGFIPQTKLTKYYTEEYPIILEHELVDMTTSKTWNKMMIKDACILMMIIKRVANQVGFTLHDGHLNNITFSCGKPIFTDIGSIVKDNGQRTAYEKGIIFAGIYKLLFIDMNNSIIKRIQMYDEENNAIWITPRYYDDSTFECYMALKKYKKFHMWHSNLLCNWIIFRLFDCYDCKPEYVDALFGEKINKQRENIVDSCDLVYIFKALDECKISFNDVVDVDGTAGKVACDIYDRYGVKVTAVEYDEMNAVEAYIRVKESYKPINTLLFHYLYGADYNTREVVKADLVVDINLTKNLRAFQEWKLDSLFNSLTKMSKKYVAVTFYECEKFNQSCFERSFKLFFDICVVKKFVNENGKQGIVYIGKKKLNFK